MSDQTFEDFKKPENQTLRAIDLPTSEEVYNQIEFPGVPDLLMQIEFHEARCSFTFGMNEDHIETEALENLSGWYVCFAQYDEVTQQIEKSQSIPISKPIPFKHSRMNHQKIFFYKGTKNEVFWFTQAPTDDFITLMVLREETIRER